MLGIKYPEQDTNTNFKEEQSLSNKQMRQNQTSPNQLLKQELKQALIYGPSLNIYLVESLSQIQKWQGIIFIRQGCFKGGKIKFTLYLPNFPYQSPQLYFNPSLYHPLVNQQTGELDINAFFNWDSSKTTILYQLISGLPSIFIDSNLLSLKHSFNPSAGILFYDNYRQFALQALKSIDKRSKIDQMTSLNLSPIPTSDLIALKQKLQKACIEQGNIEDKIKSFLKLLQ